MSGHATYLGCKVGDALPELDIAMDRTTIVAAAIASQDFEDVHHDPGKAQGRGTPDIFMSINSTNGFVDRYVTDWAGPTARLRRMSLRLGVPLFPGDTLSFRGQVSAVDHDEVTLAVTGSNDKGAHVTATVVIGPVGDPR
jgi:acyl dehydratase